MQNEIKKIKKEKRHKKKQLDTTNENDQEISAGKLSTADGRVDTEENLKNQKNKKKKRRLEKEQEEDEQTHTGDAKDHNAAKDIDHEAGEVKRSKKNKHKKNIQPEDETTNEHTVVNELDGMEASYKSVDSEEDSDEKGKPKKKKKKKSIVSEQTSEKKGKKSIRQMKKEKFAQRQAEALALSKDQLKSQCLSYLSQWKQDKQNWKFMKVKQVWLFKNKFSPNLIPDSSWPTLLEYFDSAKGNIRKLLLEDANKVIEEMDKWIDSQNSQEDKNEELEDESNKPNEISYKRARDLIQCLQE